MRRLNATHPGRRDARDGRVARALPRTLDPWHQSSSSSAPSRPLGPADLDWILSESPEVLGSFLQDGRLVIPLGGYVLAARPA